MIIIGTSFNIVDNSGVKKVLSIGKLHNISKKVQIYPGDIIIGVVKSVKSNSKIKLTTIVKCLIIRTKMKVFNNGITLHSEDNAAILLDKNNNMVGTRITGVLTSKNLSNNFLKIKSSVKYII